MNFFATEKVHVFTVWHFFSNLKRVWGNLFCTSLAKVVLDQPCYGCHKALVIITIRESQDGIVTNCHLRLGKSIATLQS